MHFAEYFIIHSKVVLAMSIYEGSVLIKNFSDRKCFVTFVLRRSIECVSVEEKIPQKRCHKIEIRRDIYGRKII